MASGQQPEAQPYDPPVTPFLLAVLLATGLLALVPTRRLAARSADGWLVGGYYAALWLVLLVLVLAPPLRRLAVPVALLLAVAPWMDVRAGLARLLGRPARPPRRPPRNVTPPEAGGPLGG